MHKSLWRLEQEYGSVIKGLFQKQKERKGLPAQTIFSFPKGLGQLCDAIGQGLGTSYTPTQRCKKLRTQIRATNYIPPKGFLSANS